MNNKLTFLSILLALSLVLPFAHAQDADNPAVPQADQADHDTTLTPLTIGNTWVYENTADNLITTEQIVGTVLFDGTPWYLLRTEERPIPPADAAPPPDQPNEQEPAFVSEVWIARRSDGEVDATTQLDDETLTLGLSAPTITYPYPVVKGQRFRPEPDNPDITGVVKAIDAQVKNKAGEFVCIVYEITETTQAGETLTFTSYLAPGVGSVRQVVVYEGEAYTSELISYKLVEQEK